MPVCAAFGTGWIMAMCAAAATFAETCTAAATVAERYTAAGTG